MRDAIHAELRKTLDHRWLTGFTLWIFPLGALGIALTLTVLVLLGADGAMFTAGDTAWIGHTLGAWSVPTDMVGQVFLLALAVSLIVGEYRWQTWTNIVPRRRRATLLLAKFIVIAGLAFVTYHLTALAAAVGSQVLVAAAGGTPGPALNDPALADFWGTYALHSGISFTGVLLAVLYGGIGALVTRSAIAGVIIAYALRTLDSGLAVLLGFGQVVLGVEGLADLYRFAPSYNLLNVQAWLSTGAGYSAISSLTVEPLSLAASLLLLALTIAGLLALNLLIFTRRDIA
jgi:hypothetical protein